MHVFDTCENSFKQPVHVFCLVLDVGGEQDRGCSVLLRRYEALGQLGQDEPASG